MEGLVNMGDTLLESMFQWRCRQVGLSVCRVQTIILKKLTASNIPRQRKEGRLSRTRAVEMGCKNLGFRFFTKKL